jgi:transcriptional regulator with PAS, ATPase and Fis domain
VDVNCANLPEHLIESELFGYEKGAFSGADAPKRGLFELADTGTFFLDEIGELAPRMQVKFLRVLDGVPYYRLGGVRKISVDVRILAATNQNLEEAIQAGKFRRDLYYRLNVFSIRLPSLRDRVEDIVPLAYHFLRRASRQIGRPPLGLSDEARRALETHRWEGNVRELRSVMERAALVCKSGMVAASDLPLVGETEEGQPAAAVADSIPNAGTLRELERQILVKTLALADGNQSQAARILGLHESTLRFRLRRAGIGTPKRAAGS